MYRNLGGSVTDEHSDVKISLKIRTVLISRPWLEISMLSNRNFTIDGGDPGSWSTGELNANNKGSFPLLSTQMIVAKDITVTASTEMERKAISDPVSCYAKQKHLGVKKCEANGKQHASRQVQPKGMISAEAKKLLYQNTFNSLNDI